MVTKDEALKMAIEGMVKAEKVFDDIGLLLIKFGVNPSDINFHKESFLAPAIQACKEALAQPAVEQGEPVAWYWDNNHRDKIFYVGIERGSPKMDAIFGTPIPLYTAPPPQQWAGLTTKQIEQIEEKSYVLQTGVNDYEFDFIHFAKAIQAKLKELNT